MTERPTGADEATPACPFVAFEDDRDGRSAVPDHRHRCYAEIRPASRSLPHQDAYCVSAAFPACPTFLEWARREAARARTPAVPPPPSPVVNVEQAPLAPLPEKGPIYPSGPPPAAPATPPPGAPGAPGTGGPGTVIGRTSRRDWAAPPPWMLDRPAPPAPGGPGAPGGSGEPEEPGVAAPVRPDPSAGLAATAAAWLGDDPEDADATGDPAADAPEGAAMILPARSRRRPAPSDMDDAARADADRGDAEDDERPLDGRRRSGRVPPRGPAWEEPIRGERFPTLRTPVGLPSLSPLVLWALALVAASVFLFFVPPMLIRLGEGGEAVATPSPAPTPVPTVAASPTPTPAPTPRVYVIVQNDTLSAVAGRFGLTLEQLLAANPAISDPDRVVIGDELIIPTPPPETVQDGAAPSTVEDAGTSPAP
ncbi:MAG: hypothetical protein RL338_1644 [Chloroflexota bacterium]